MKTVLLIVCCSWTAGTASAQNCGAMLRTMSYFRGTIHSVKPLSGEGLLNDVDIDPRFAVEIDVESVDPGSPAPKAGEILVFAIHSPSRTFGHGKLVGRSVDLEAERIDCNGVFWHFIRLERHLKSSPVEAFDGHLEVGHMYRATTTWDGHDLALPKPLELPMHHDGGVNFMNAGTFLKDRENVSRIVFEVVALHITMIDEGSWLSMYDAKITRSSR